MGKMIEQMKEESARPIPLIAKTLRFEEEIDEEMRAYAKEHGIRLSVLQRNALRIGWEAIKSE